MALLEFVEAKRTDTYCNKIRKYIASPNTAFTYDRDRKMARKAPNDGVIQKVVPGSLCTRILDFADCSLPDGLPGERWMYDWLRENVYCPHTMRDVYPVVNNCKDCPRMGSKFIHPRKLELFPPAGSLVFLAVDILGQHPRAEAGNQLFIRMKGRYTKLARGVLTTKITSTKVANIIINDCIIPYGTPDTVLSDYGQQFVIKFFTSLCSYIAPTKLTTTAFHLQANDQAERYNKTIVFRIRL